VSRHVLWITRFLYEHVFRVVYIFLGALAKLRKTTISFVMSVCLYISVERLGRKSTEFHEMWVYPDGVQLHICRCVFTVHFVVVGQSNSRRCEWVQSTQDSKWVKTIVQYLSSHVGDNVVQEVLTLPACHVWQRGSVSGGRWDSVSFLSLWLNVLSFHKNWYLSVLWNSVEKIHFTKLEQE
jgi:hypothetical protein